MSAERDAFDVLVVEDEDRLRSFVVRALPEMGLRGVGARSAAEARATLDAHDVRVLLLDIRLGGDNGLELLESLRAQGDERPAVVMTAFADVPSVQRALRGGAADYITKPFRLAELEEALSRACREAGSSLPRRGGEAAADGSGREVAGPVSAEMAKRNALFAALERAKGNKRQAAQELGISRRTLYNWLERYSE